jgi:hypothetical protein
MHHGNATMLVLHGLPPIQKQIMAKKIPDFHRGLVHLIWT